MKSSRIMPYSADDESNKATPTERTGAIEAPEQLPYTRLNFCGILISGLIILVATGYFIISILFHYDKRGKEAYYSDDPDTERDLSYVFANPPTTGVLVRTEYWGWFERSHDADSMLKVYDVYYLTFIVGIIGGVYWVLLGVREIFKYNNNDTSKEKCVSHYKN